MDKYELFDKFEKTQIAKFLKNINKTSNQNHRHHNNKVHYDGFEASEKKTAKKTFYIDMTNNYKSQFAYRNNGLYVDKNQLQYEENKSKISIIIMSIVTILLILIDIFFGYCVGQVLISFIQSGFNLDNMNLHSLVMHNWIDYVFSKDSNIITVLSVLIFLLTFIFITTTATLNKNTNSETAKNLKKIHKIASSFCFALIIIVSLILLIFIFK